MTEIADAAWKAQAACYEVMEKSVTRTLDEQKAIRRELAAKGDRSGCTKVQDAWLGTALLTSRRKYTGDSNAWIQHGIQFMPTFSLGFPAGFLTEENDARRALRNLQAVPGFHVRYTPVGFYLNLNIFAGIPSIDPQDLQHEYTSPAMWLVGGGVDVLGGVAAFNVLQASLRPDTLFSNTAQRATVLMVNFDLTAVGLSVAGAL